MVFAHCVCHFATRFAKSIVKQLEIWGVNFGKLAGVAAILGVTFAKSTVKQIEIGRVNFGKLARMFQKPMFFFLALLAVFHTFADAGRVQPRCRPGL